MLWVFLFGIFQWDDVRSTQPHTAADRVYKDFVHGFDDCFVFHHQTGHLHFAVKKMFNFFGRHFFRYCLGGVCDAEIEYTTGTVGFRSVVFR